MAFGGDVAVAAMPGSSTVSYINWIQSTSNGNSAASNVNVPMSLRPPSSPPPPVPPLPAPRSLPPDLVQAIPPFNRANVLPRQPSNLTPFTRASIAVSR